MIKHDGVYYLTYAPIGYGSRTGYSVSVAVSNSPFGPFTKMDREHGNPALNIEAHQDWMAGPGHHCFTEVGDEIFVFYHSLMDRATGDSNPRGIAYDRVTFIDGSNYDIPAEKYGIKSETGTFDMLYANGPTWSVQPLPAEITGYRNVAGEATVTADSGADTVKYLNDGLFVAHEYAEHMEYMSEGAATITLTFPEPKEVTALMIYNSNDYTCAFKYIDSIRFDLSEPPSTYNGDRDDGVDPQSRREHRLLQRRRARHAFGRGGGRAVQPDQSQEHHHQGVRASRYLVRGGIGHQDLGHRRLRQIRRNHEKETDFSRTAGRAGALGVLAA